MDAPPQVVCVTGPAAAFSDFVLFEHLLFDFTSRCQPAADASFANEPITLRRLHSIRRQCRSSLASLRSPGVDGMLAELESLRDTCPACAVVDCTAPGSGRDPAGLLSLSRRSGVPIIMAAAVGVDDAICAANVASAAEDSATQDESRQDELSDALVAELTTGVPLAGSSAETVVRAGILTAGEVPVLATTSTLTPELARARAITLRALGRAQMRSGAPILCSLPAAPADGAGAIEAMHELVNVHGASASAIIVRHAQNLLTADGRTALTALLSLGVHLCFDGVGDTWSVAGAEAVDAELSPPPTDGEVAREVAKLAASGHATKLLVSHGVASSLQLEVCGGAGLTHVHSSFVPHLVRAGLSADEVALVRGSNAARLLCWWRPAERPPRVTKAWECSACHQKYEEAVNPAEALDTDRVYYEKFHYRYCSIPCMSAHRKAGFKEPFACDPPAA